MNDEIGEYEIMIDPKKERIEEETFDMTDSQNKLWNATATRCLINYFKIFYPQVKRGDITNKAIWKLISEKLKKDNNLNFSPEDVENRWKFIKRNHKKNVNFKIARRKSGLEFQPDMDEMSEGDKEIELENDQDVEIITFKYSKDENDSSNTNYENFADKSPVEQTKNPTLKNTWNVRSTKLLIECLKLYRPQTLCGMMSNKLMWQRISEKLKKDYNLHFSSEMCENRTKVLRRNYENVLSSNLQKVFEYQKEMSELYEIEKNDINEVIIQAEVLNQEEVQQATSEISEHQTFHTYVTDNNDNSKITIVYDKTPLENIEQDTCYKMWDSDATKTLISCFKFYNPRVGRTEVKNYKMMWKKISEKMVYEHMLNFSSSACENRWKVLKRNYESVQNGKRKRSFDFFEEMDELYGKERKEKMAKKLIETKDDTVVSDTIEIVESVSFADIRKDMQQYHIQKMKIKEEMLEQGRRRNILLAERNNLLKKLIQTIAAPFDKPGS